MIGHCLSRNTGVRATRCAGLLWAANPVDRDEERQVTCTLHLLLQYDAYKKLHTYYCLESSRKHADVLSSLHRVILP